MAESDDEDPRIHLIGETHEVTDLSTGEQVNRPDVAARAIGAMTQAVESAGGTLDGSKVRPILPGMVTGYTPKDPSYELTIDYRVPLLVMIARAGITDVDPAFLSLPASSESGVVQVTTKLINLDRLIDGAGAAALLGVHGFRPAVLAELLALVIRSHGGFYEAFMPALGTLLTSEVDGVTRVPVVVSHEGKMRLTLEPYDADFASYCRYLAAAA